MKARARMSTAAVDRECAERVMGWPRYESPTQTVSIDGERTRPFAWAPKGGGAPLWPTSDTRLRIQRAPDDNPFEVWSPSTDAHADLEVLAHVRGTWTKRRLREFANALDAIWAARDWSSSVLRGPIGYKPGDYARAALTVLRYAKPDKGAKP